VAISGDLWAVFSAGEGAYLASPIAPPNVMAGCWFTSVRFSPVTGFTSVGMNGATFSVFDGLNQQPILQLPTQSCNGRSSFSPDGTLLATSAPELYRTSDGSRLWPAQVVPGPPPIPQFFDAFRDVQFSPAGDSLLLSDCPLAAVDGGTLCQHSLYSVATGAEERVLPELTSQRAHFSPEGNWVVSGNTVLHLPTNESLQFDPAAQIATFTPAGDIIAILNDATLALYCRTP
jgi:WD40 repeat protein